MDRLSDDWENIKRVILYGYGLIGKSCIKKIKEDFRVLFIIDNDEKKQVIFGSDIPIIGLEEAGEKIKNNKVIIMTGGRTYQKISCLLTEKGLIEYQDYCSIERFITEWYWKYKRKNCLMEVHTAITTRCTFKCEKCNMFIPYYKKQKDYSFEEIKEDLELLFERVDYIFSYKLLGGEPFLNKDLEKILEYLRMKCNSRIGKIGIITNGSIIPDFEVLSIIREYGIDIYISDYTKTIPYKNMLKDFLRVLKKEKITYYLREVQQWSDFGFPQKPVDIANEKIRGHMLSCSPIFHGLNDRKFYYCHVAWSAEKAGLICLKESDFLDLKKISPINDSEKRSIAEHSMAILKDEYISFCKVCGGCGADNRKLVMAGIQVQ